MWLLLVQEEGLTRRLNCTVGLPSSLMCGRAKSTEAIIDRDGVGKKHDEFDSIGK